MKRTTWLGGVDEKAISWHLLFMAFALAKEQQSFINRMVKEGRFNNQSEVVREALRQMEQNDKAYLNPPPLTKQRLAEIYRPNAEADRHEKIAARTMHHNRGRLIKKLMMTRRCSTHAGESSPLPVGEPL